MRRFLHILLCLLLSGFVGQSFSYAQDLEEVNTLMKTSYAQLEQRDYRGAMAGFRNVADRTKPQRTRAEHEAYVFSQTMVAQCLYMLQQYQEGFDLAGIMLHEALSEEERTSLTHLYVSCGYGHGLECMSTKKRQFAEARAYFDKVLPFADEEMRTRILSRRPMSWYFEGVIHKLGQHYEEALICLEEARSGFREIDDRAHEMETVCQIGEVKKNANDRLGAVQAYVSAESLAEQDKDKLSILKEQYSLYEALDNDEMAWNVAHRIDSLFSLVKDAASQFEFNDLMGDQSLAQNRHLMAERWYLKNEPLLPELSDEAKQYTHYFNLRDLYGKTGQWEKALFYANLAKEISQKMRSSSDPGYYTNYNFIADIYRRKGDSLRCFRNLDSLFMAVPLINEPRELQFIYFARGQAYATFGNYAKALEDYRKAEELLASRYGEDDGDRVAMLPLMGGMEHRLGHYDESERMYRMYADGQLKLAGGNSSDYIAAVGYLANAEAFAGHLDAACRDYTDAVTKIKQQVRRKWPYLSTVQREAYWAEASEPLRNMASFALGLGEHQTPFTQTCYDGLALTKAFLLESEQSTYDLVKHHGTAEDLEVFLAILAIQDRIRVWESHGQEYADSILTATTRVARLESSLSRRCRAYGDATAFMGIDYTQIRQSLDDNEVLVDFTDFISNSRGRIYAAYIIDNQQSFPYLKELFQERSIDSLHVRYAHQFYTGKPAETVSRLLWAPLKDFVKEGATVYYVPTQLLFQIAPESLPAGDGTLLGDHYRFVRLSSARELVRYRESLDLPGTPDGVDAVLYGGLQYSLDGSVMESEARKHDVPRMFAFRGNDETVRGDSLFHDLPGSKVEIESIAAELKEAHRSVHPYMGKEGTEESFLSLSGHAPRILHLATHGFYYTPDAAQEVDYLRGFSDAMSLSGLVLAGGNAAWLGQRLPEGVLGGILTAAEIARMDLNGVDMVVLSACHSGKGEATPEGLYGLQRAFKKAGVKTIVMSLWAESDRVGPEFMEEFYRNLAGSAGWNKRIAFDKAKEAIRRKYPDSPSFWAGFVMLD